jgi:hypothetical protein
MPIKTRASQLVLALLVATAPAAHASFVSYGIDFTVEYAFSGPGYASLDPRVAIGNIYTGSFSVDSAILAQDAINVAGDVGAFSISMEDVSWVMGNPFSSFAGFRGPGGQGAASPGFDVVGGQITNLRGGVFGGADFPFVDFSTDARLPFTNTAGCSGRFCGNRANAFSTSNPLGAFGGSMAVHAVAAPVPEPEAFAMLFAGFALVGLARRWVSSRPG